MEDVLEVYHRPYDLKRPQVCMDETSKPLVEPAHTPLPAAPGQVARCDDAYGRAGVADVFCAVEPLRGKVLVEGTEHRTRVDWAFFVRDGLDTVYPEADCVVWVLDNLSTHSTAAFYEAFPAAEARRLVEKLEIPFTPTHGSGLNRAEIERSILSRVAELFRGPLKSRCSNSQRGGVCLAG
jgi:hypothetical protein